MNDLETFGLFFEDFAVRDLRIYANYLGGEKLIEEGAVSLKRLQNKIIEKSSEKSPSFLMVLTAIGDTYIREDGVIVAPITSLKP